ncbi:hypothetical protein OPQ81_000526 [Rhizoctonia solani]|nr:hypothetical protein OPQ81_000526 [Rhizoctonia solani]
MTNTSPDTHKVTPVLLAELETLITPKWSLEELGQFLRLIRPGSRPLSIALDMPNGYHSSASSFRGPPGLSIAKFLVSTNALTICITGSYHYWQVAFLVKMAPRARVLVLNKLDLGNTKPEKYTAVKETRHGPHLDDLYVVDTMISQSFLLWLIKVYHVRRLTITNDSKVTQGSDTIGKEQIYADISHLGCNFKSITSDEPYPMK